MLINPNYNAGWTTPPWSLWSETGVGVEKVVKTKERGAGVEKVVETRDKNYKLSTIMWSDNFEDSEAGNSWCLWCEFSEPFEDIWLDGKQSQICQSTAQVIDENCR